MTNPPLNFGSPSLFPHLDEADRDQLREVAHRLLTQGSLLREENSTRDLYDWCQNRTQLVEEWASLLGLKIVWRREERLILAIPEYPSLLKRLRLDETLVLLALWYDFDIEVRERGAHEVAFSIRDFNEKLASKFNRLKLPSESRMRQILRLLDRNNLVRLTGAEQFASATIRVLPTIRFVIPFPSIEEWSRHAERFQQISETGEEGAPLETDSNEEDDES
jgi:hypothetical protein